MAPRIYPSLPGSTPLYCDYVKCIRLLESTPPSQNIPTFQQLYATLPESTLPSQNLPPFSTTICDPPITHPSLPEYTPLFNNYNILRPSQNLPLPPKIYPHFQQLYANLPESTPPSQNIPPLSTTICDPPRIYPSMPKYTILFNNYMRPSKNLPVPLGIYPLFHNYNIMRLSQILPLPPRIYPPPLSRTIRFCDPQKICPSFPEYFSVLGANGRFSHSYV